MELTSDFIEKAFLCSLLTNREILPDIVDLVKPEEFNNARNQIIFEALTNLYESGSDTGIPSLVGKLNVDGLLNAAGGIQHLRDIVAPSESNLLNADPVGMAMLIKEEHKRNQLGSMAFKLDQQVKTRDGATAYDILAEVEQEVLSLSAQDETTSSASVEDLLPGVIDGIVEAGTLQEDVPLGIPTGFPDLDKMTGGFRPGQMIIIAARPAVGKSTLAVDFARNGAFLAGKTVLFFSLEMDKQEVVRRILSAESRVEAQKFKTGGLDEQDWMNITEAKARLAQGNFIIDDNPKTGISRVRSVATRQKHRPEGLDMIVIDYLGLMETPKTNRSSDSRQTDISELSRNIKLLAKELGVPVIILSQLNRKSEDRQDRRPQVSDLRESGSLEQDADMVFLIHRPESIDESNRPGETDLILGKHRGGPTGVIPLVSMLSYCKFVPGQGKHEREPEFLGDGTGAEFASTVDEQPW